MKQTLPWESVPPPIYTARVPKPRKKWVTVGGWVLVAVLLTYGYASFQRNNMLLACVSLVFAVMYTLTLLMKKDAVVTTRGLEIFYQMQITTQYDFFSWDRINSIVREDRAHPELVRLHIGYSSMEKALFFTKSDADAIIKLAKEKNPAIRVLDFENAPKQSSKRKRK